MLGKIARDRLFRLAALALAVFAPSRPHLNDGAVENVGVLTRAKVFADFIRGGQ